jgi:hypothetical protein
MMKSGILATMLILAAVPAVSSAPLGFDDAEARYACGKACRETKLVCVRDAQESAPAGLTVQDIGADLPLGQIDFWFMMGSIADRPESGIVDARRRQGPEVVSFGGHDWVWADYDLPAALGTDLAGRLLMWPEGDQMAMLRCSFLVHANARTMIEELAASLRN